MHSFRNYIALVADAWKTDLKDKLFRLKLFLAPGVFFLYSLITQELGTYIEIRQGIQLKDRLLMLLPSFDCSIYIFLLLYSTIVIFLITHLNKPRIILRVMEMHLLVAAIRQVCILLFALEPPSGMIMLQDIFLENTFYPPDSPLTKDLFFSGHVATIWIYFLCSKVKFFKVYLVFVTLCMSFMVLSMRVHYTYDVYGAIVFTTLTYFTPYWVRRYYLLKEPPTWSNN